MIALMPRFRTIKTLAKRSILFMLVMLMLLMFVPKFAPQPVYANPLVAAEVAKRIFVAVCAAAGISFAATPQAQAAWNNFQRSAVYAAQEIWQMANSGAQVVVDHFVNGFVVTYNQLDRLLNAVIDWARPNVVVDDVTAEVLLVYTCFSSGFVTYPANGLENLPIITTSLPGTIDSFLFRYIQNAVQPSLLTRQMIEYLTISAPTSFVYNGSLYTMEPHRVGFANATTRVFRDGEIFLGDLLGANRGTNHDSLIPLGFVIHEYVNTNTNRITYNLRVFYVIRQWGTFVLAPGVNGLSWAYTLYHRSLYDLTPMWNIVSIIPSSFIATLAAINAVSNILSINAEARQKIRDISGATTQTDEVVLLVPVSSANTINLTVTDVIASPDILNPDIPVTPIPPDVIDYSGYFATIIGLLTALPTAIVGPVVAGLGTLAPAIYNPIINGLNAIVQPIASPIVAAVNTVAVGVTAIPGLIVDPVVDGLLDVSVQVAALPAAIAVATVGDMSFNFNSVRNTSASLVTLFPFSIPFDFVAAVQTLNVSASPPTFHFDMSETILEYSFTIDFSEYERIAQIIRWVMGIGVYWLSMKLTPRFIKW